jgi:putative ABC transport system permease protein
MLETFDQLFGAIFMVGLALSAVGLLVGRLSAFIAIMMISVTERTREIGVRKALEPPAPRFSGNSWSRRRR